MASFEVEMLRVYNTAACIEGIMFSLRDSTMHLFPFTHGRNKHQPPIVVRLLRVVQDGCCACTVRHRPKDPIRMLVADSPSQLADKVLKLVQPEMQSEECVMG